MTGYEEHPVFEKPDTDNAVLWRYLDFAKFVDLLATGGLYFSRADRLGDPFEGSYPEFNVAQRAAVYAAQGLDGETVAKLLPQLSEASRALPRFTYVNCWTLATYESAALWNIYTGRNGVAIRASFGRLVEVLRPAEHLVHAGRVKYIDYRSEWLPEGNTLYPFVHKRRSFQFESEIRAVIQEFPGNISAWGSASGPVGYRVPVDVATLIERVHVSPAAPEWFSGLVTRVCEKFGLLVDVRQSELAGDPVY